ncbi:PEP-CTERM sorting domain-containing protein [Pelagibius sp. Alg239-R121]|uniref:PEP-CTERM sorting domain-containing protein n=1 Tax=Pelagibius sp. Alg239-R121 TaxID=2993448 RepID=UPI0024A6BFD8|nr:PEP-CTERM sorting domain-containing protein [Pelagibius sp. Alg239-R121]
MKSAHSFAGIRWRVINPIVIAIALAGSLLTVAESSAAVIVEDSIDANFVALGQWYENDVRPGGTAAIVSVSGTGGTLENNAPLPQGAARLTTGFDNNHKAEVGVADSYGTAGNILNNSFNLGYSFYKVDVPGGNTFAAPSIKLTFSNPLTTQNGGDGFVTLVYEPYLNGNSPVATGDWTDVQIDLTSGLFWQTGGFGQTFDQTKLLTLSDWLTEFDPDFLDAQMLLLSVGVGSFNQGQDGYFDNVSLAFQTIGATTFDKTYDFEVASTAVPEPGSLGLLGIGLLGLGLARLRFTKSAI